MLLRIGFLWICFTLICSSLGAFASAECTKEAAEKKVIEICSQIEAVGRSIQKKWPKELLFENCGDNYVWVQDTNEDIHMVMHPIKRRLDGTSLKNYEDENRFRLFVEFDRVAKENYRGAWVDYVWTKSGEYKATLKTSFVKSCFMKDGKSWVVGSGVWIDDLKKEK